MGESIRNKAGKALGWDLIGNYGGQISAFVISIFLARLLEPEEFGLVGMSMVFISILRIFMDMGFASALVQSKSNSSLIYSSVFYLNIFCGGVLTIIIYFCAPWIGIFFESDVVTELVRFLSVAFFISSFNIVQSTILKRALDFKRLTYRDLVSQVSAGVIAIIFAFNGFGVYALVTQVILSEVIKTFLLWNVSGWYPKLEFSLTEVKKLTGFSVYVLAAQSINQVIKQMDTLIVGKLFTPSTLGFYSRANSLNSVINRNSVRSISNVFFPTLSKIQDDSERFKSIYLRLINIVSGISVLITGIFFLSGEEVIIGLFGEKWEPSVFIFQILIIKGFTYPISSMIVSAFLAQGKSKENFHYGNIRKLLQISPFFVAYYYGFTPFLYALIGVSILNWLLNNYFVSCSLKISFFEQTKAVVPYLVLGLMIILLIMFVFPGERNYILALVKVISFVVIFIYTLYIFNSVLTKEIEFYLRRAWVKLRSI